MSLTVLITNLFMDWPSGTVVYTRDLAFELKRQGHRPIVYTWLKGRVSRELVEAGIEVVDDLWRIRARPDVIHGHHRPLVRGALLRFRDVPAVVFCHNSSDPWDAPLPDPAIRRYFGVSALCVKRLLSEGAPVEQTGFRTNFVDLARFKPRTPLPQRPTRALVFSNYAAEDTHLPAVEEACRRLDLPLDVIGRGVGRASDQPERLLAQYDLVFAKAKAAMEAMAVGAAVVLCDFGGLGPMVTASDFDRLRPLNFGLEALVEPITPEGVRRQIERYNTAEAGLVRERIRTRCGLELAVREMIEVYRQVIDEAGADRDWREAGGPGPAGEQHLAVLRYRASKTAMANFYRVFGCGPRRGVPGPLKPVYRLVRAMMRRWVGVG